MEQGPSGSQEIRRILRNTSVFTVYTTPTTLIPIVGEVNPVPYLSLMHV
jgi:hypothetical protein